MANGTMRMVRPQLVLNGSIYCDFVFEATNCADSVFLTQVLWVNIGLGLTTALMGVFYFSWKIFKEVGGLLSLEVWGRERNV